MLFYTPDLKDIQLDINVLLLAVLSYNKSRTESYPSESHCTRLVGLTFGYGVFARENNSHNTIPKDHTSDCVENILSVIHSIASHFTGRGL